MAKHAADGKIITVNRKARHDYFVLEAFEAGIELTGTEVKSVRAGGVNLKDSWCSIDNGELFLKGAHISPYEKGNIFNKDPFRVRKLLMHKSEIARLYGNVKVELGLCKGKQLHDKRADMAERDAKREIDRALKSRQHG